MQAGLSSVCWVACLWVYRSVACLCKTKAAWWTLSGTFRAAISVSSCLPPPVPKTGICSLFWSGAIQSLIHQCGNTWCSTAHTFTAKSIKQFQPSPSHSWVSQWLSRAAFIFLPFVYKMPWASGWNVEHNIDGCKSHWPLFHHVVGAEGSLELAEEISCNTGMETNEENGLLCLSSMRANDCLEVSTGNGTENERRRKRKREKEKEKENVLAVGGCGPGSRSVSA